MNHFSENAHRPQEPGGASRSPFPRRAPASLKWAVAGGIALLLVLLVRDVRTDRDVPVEETVAAMSGVAAVWAQEDGDDDAHAVLVLEHVATTAEIAAAVDAARAVADPVVAYAAPAGWTESDEDRDDPVTGPTDRLVLVEHDDRADEAAEVLRGIAAVPGPSVRVRGWWEPVADPFAPPARRGDGTPGGWRLGVVSVGTSGTAVPRVADVVAATANGAWGRNVGAVQRDQGTFSSHVVLDCPGRPDWDAEGVAQAVGWAEDRAAAGGGSVRLGRGCAEPAAATLVLDPLREGAPAEPAVPEIAGAQAVPAVAAVSTTATSPALVGGTRADSATEVVALLGSLGEVSVDERRRRIDVVVDDPATYPAVVEAAASLPWQVLSVRTPAPLGDDAPSFGVEAPLAEHAGLVPVVEELVAAGGGVQVVRGEPGPDGATEDWHVQVPAGGAFDVETAEGRARLVDLLRDAVDPEAVARLAVSEGGETLEGDAVLTRTVWFTADGDAPAADVVTDEDQVVASDGELTGLRDLVAAWDER